MTNYERKIVVESVVLIERKCYAHLYLISSVVPAPMVGTIESKYALHMSCDQRGVMAYLAAQATLVLYSLYIALRGPPVSLIQAL